MGIFEGRLRTDNARLRFALDNAKAEYEREYQRAEEFARTVEGLRAQLAAANTFAQILEDRTAILKDTIEMLKEQNRGLLDTLRGPETFNSDPLATARRNLALAQAEVEQDAEQVEEDERTLVDRMAQFNDPGYVPPLVKKIIDAARQAKLDAQAEEPEA